MLERVEKETFSTGKLSCFSGTIPLKGRVSYRGEFRMELAAPILKRSIKRSYTVTILPGRN